MTTEFKEIEPLILRYLVILMTMGYLPFLIIGSLGITFDIFNDIKRFVKK